MNIILDTADKRKFYLVTNNINKLLNELTINKQELNFSKFLLNFARYFSTPFYFELNVFYRRFLIDQLE